MAKTLRIAVLAAATCAAAAPSPAQTIVVDKAKTEPRIARTETLPAPIAVASGADAQVAAPSALLYRIHFTVADASSGWTIRIAAGAKTWTSQLDASVRDLWSDDLTVRPASVAVRLDGPPGQPSPRVAVDRVAVKDERPTPQAITPPGDQSQAIGSGSARIKTWGKSVARLQFVGGDGNGYYCTAFLVSAALMLTNNHCISTDAEMRSAIAEFDYDAAGAQVETHRFTELVAHDETLDYAVLRLDAVSARAPFQLSDVPLAEKKGLLIIEHPAGKPKRFSRTDCHVTGVSLPGLGTTATDFGHFCDTEGGSSGSPIQDFPTGAVLGLHHLGFQPGDSLVVNRGVKIGLILTDLAQRAPAARREIGAP